MHSALKNILLALGRKKNVLVVGCDGMLGREVFSHLQKLSKDKKSKIGLVCKLSHSDIDFSCPDDIDFYFESGEFHLPDAVVNCAGFTDTAAIESTNSGYLKGYISNVILPMRLAQACAKHGVMLVHVSTDYVMSEMCLDKSIQASEFPINVYGAQKLLAEKYIQEAYSAAKSDKYLIARTSWLFGPNSQSKTFPEKIAKKLIQSAAKAVSMLEEGPLEFNLDVNVDINTAGYPTSTKYLSQFIGCAVQEELYGIADAFQPYLIYYKSKLMNGHCKPKRFSVTRVSFAKEVENILMRSKEFGNVYKFSKVNSAEFKSSDECMKHPAKLPKYARCGSNVRKYIRCCQSATQWQQDLAEFLLSPNVIYSLKESISGYSAKLQSKLSKQPIDVQP